MNVGAGGLDDRNASEISADDETLQVVARLRAKNERTEGEQAFLDYFASRRAKAGGAPRPL